MADQRGRSPALASQQQQLVTRLSGFGSFVAGGIFLAMLSTLLTTLVGFGSYNSQAPFPMFVNQHLFLVPFVGGLVVVCVCAWLLARRSRAGVALAAALPVAGYVLFGLLLLLVVAHPSWCPRSLCTIVTNPHGANDGTLEIYKTAVQSAAYVMTDNPSKYSLSNLPQSIAAQRIDVGTSEYPYRAVVSVHSLLSSGYSILIERVEVVVTQVPVTPNPLNVFIRGPSTVYQTNVYSVLYQGEDVGVSLPAVYRTVPLGHLVLAPGETDTLDLQVNSSVPADLRYRVRVTYRVANEAAEHSLTVPDTFEVVFANGANWHPYQLTNGQLISSK
jgi:hypothetical protein